jgi:hypothetical protein
MGVVAAPKGSESHEFTPFATMLSDGEAPFWFLTGAARPGELETQSDYITKKFNGLQTREFW